MQIIVIDKHNTIRAFINYLRWLSYCAFSLNIQVFCSVRAIRKLRWCIYTYLLFLAAVALNVWLATGIRSSYTPKSNSKRNMNVKWTMKIMSEIKLYFDLSKDSKFQCLGNLSILDWMRWVILKARFLYALFLLNIMNKDFSEKHDRIMFK